ncbi:hypothetical protein GYH30_022821 [Glycine max]|uniref:Integrase zinc-binding domain-containing protein n=1 Tax=Glycine max TaxID=3847 RepID=A0A0R0IZX0_SOYBN|nr:hypothetical protein GYH30_022821 [Glycine max]
MYHIPKESNTRADLFSKLANTKKIEHLKTIIQDMIQTPTINTEEVMAGEEEANYYVTLNGELIKRGLTTPLLKCLNSQQVDYIMRELHEGICGLYTGGSSFTTKVVCADYYWPTLRVDALGL